MYEYQMDKSAFYYEDPFDTFHTYYDRFRMPREDRAISSKPYFIHKELPEFYYTSDFVPSAGYRIHTQTFELENADAVVLLIHGYMSHTGTYHKTIESLIRMNYTVVSIDLPGHGLSSGPRGDVDRFSSYGIIVEDIVNKVKKHSPSSPVYAVGHSTGASSLIEYLLGLEGNRIDKAVLACPLVKNVYWNITNLGFLAASPFITTFQFKKQASHPVDFNVFPLSWYSALRTWNSRNSYYGKSSADILLIHAENDEVVSNSASWDYIDNHFINKSYYMVENSNHVIFSAPDEILDPVFMQIQAYFQGRSSSREF